MPVLVAAFHSILASSTLLPLLRSPRAASGAVREVVLHRFADAVARGDFAEAEAQATRLLDMPLR